MTRNIRPERGYESPNARFWRQARKEMAYVVSERYTVAGGGTANMHLKNPSGSNKTAVFQEVGLSTQFKGELDVFDRFSNAPSGGTSLTIQNQVMDSGNGSADSGDMVANKGVSFTASGTHVKKAFGGGPGGNQGVQNGPKVFSMEPGREVVVEVSNTSGTENKCSITMQYFEIESRITNEL